MEESEYNEEMEKEALKSAYRNVFSGDAGELVLQDLMNVCMDEQTACYPSRSDGGIDALMMANCTGRQDVARHIRAMLKED